MSRSDFIAIRQVTKRFGSFKAVDNVSVDVMQGEFFSLLGPSGCGKTTLLRMLAGFEMPSEGAILIDGADMTTVPAHLRPTNMVFQSYAIFPHLNVEANIAYGMRKSGLSKAELRRKVDAALEMVKLEGYGRRRANELSGGQRQRVALARALIKQPKVLLLDEPLGALDKKLREDMQIELRLLQRELGITFLFVTHDQEEALTMSDRVAVMGSGKVLQVASPTELYEQPNCIEVAGFIGTMNFLKGRPSSNGRFAAEGLGDLHVNLPQAGGEELTLGLRPERVLLGRAAEGAANRLQGEVIAVAFLGDRCHVHVRVGELDKALIAHAGAADGWQVGKQATVGWQADAAVPLLR